MKKFGQVEIEILSRWNIFFWNITEMINTGSFEYQWVAWALNLVTQRD